MSLLESLSYNIKESKKKKKKKIGLKKKKKNRLKKFNYYNLFNIT